MEPFRDNYNVHSTTMCEVLDFVVVENGLDQLFTHFEHHEYVVFGSPFLAENSCKHRIEVVGMSGTGSR